MKRITAIIALFIAVAFSACAPATPRPTPTANPNGKWESFSDVDQMDNSKTVGIRLDADNVIEAWLDKPRPNLFVRCKKSGMDVYVNVGTHAEPEYGSDDFTATLKFGDEDAVDAKMIESDDGESLFFKSGNVHDIIDRLTRTEKLIFRFHALNAGKVDATFYTAGIKNAIAPVLKECPDY